MINVTDKHNCCGCSACVQKCPKQCISLVEDYEGFLYPHVDSEQCIDCRVCETVCPVINQNEKRIPLQTLAAINKDEDVRMQSSSGGIFTVLAEKVIGEGGVVFGARFDEQWQVTIDYAETIEGLSAFRGSKYVQARTGNTYIQCEQFLKNGRKVLYSGTPCQIAGLKHYLRTEYDNLITVDVVCHGVPSPKVWRKYLDEVTSIANVKGVSMRDKIKGWQNYHFTVEYEENGKNLTLSSPHGENDYMKAFLKDMILRPSCYQCKVRDLRSESDITIGDYWGISGVRPNMNDNKGICLVLVNTEKGKKVFESVDINYEETTFEEGYRGNSAIFRSPTPWFRRQKFFNSLDSSPSVIGNIRKCLKPTFKMNAINTYYSLRYLPGRVLHKLYEAVITRDKSAKVAGGDRLLIINNLNKHIKLSEIQFRDKTTGWSSFRMTIKLK